MPTEVVKTDLLETTELQRTKKGTLQPKPWTWIKTHSLTKTTKRKRWQNHKKYRLHNNDSNKIDIRIKYSYIKYSIIQTMYATNNTIHLTSRLHTNKNSSLFIWKQSSKPVGSQTRWIADALTHVVNVEGKTSTWSMHQQRGNPRRRQSKKILSLLWTRESACFHSV